MDILKQLADEFNIRSNQVNNTVKLIDEGNTIPFISRYRKEMTGGLDDQLLRELSERLSYLRNLEARKAEVLQLIESGGNLNEKITADLVKGSITDEYLATDFVAKITSNVNAASSSAESAASSATDAATDAKLAQSYAIGGSGMRDGEDTDNAKYYAQKSAENLDYAKNLVTSGDDITE